MAKRQSPKLRANQFPTAERRNEDLIRDAIEQFKITNNSEVFDLITRHVQNFEAIEDDALRSQSYEKAGVNEITDEERVNRCVTSRGDGTTKRQRDWARCINNGRLTNRGLYHSLCKTRLMEQIRKVRGQVEKAWIHASTQQEIAEQSGECGAIHHSNVDPDPLPRISTGIEELDKICGTTPAHTDEVSGKEIPDQWGFVRGFVYAFGAAEGVGKTRLMVSLLKDICSPKSKKSWFDGRQSRVGGLRGLYFQAELARSQFVSVFTNKVWDEDTNIMLSGDTMLEKHFSLIDQVEPDIVVIDSKDMLHEFKRANLFERAFMQYKRKAVENGFVLIVISHLNKEGKLKGSNMMAYLADATLYANPMKHDRDLFSVAYGKNRSGRTKVQVHFRHNQTGVEYWEKGVKRTELDPDLEILMDDVEPRRIEQAD